MDTKKYILSMIYTKTNLSDPITNFEHGSGYKDNSYRRYEFYAEVPGTRFTSSHFALAFSAHGNGADRWYFGNVKIQVCLSNESRKITNMRYVTNAVVDDLWS